MLRIKNSLTYGLGQFSRALARVLANIDASENSESSVEICASDCSQCASENFHIPENDGTIENAQSLFGSNKSSLKKFKPNNSNDDEDKENNQEFINTFNQLNLNASNKENKENDNDVPSLGKFSIKRVNRNPLGDLSLGGGSNPSSKKRRLCDISQDIKPSGDQLNQSNILKQKNNMSMDQANIRNSSKPCKHQVVVKFQNETDKATMAQIEHMSVKSIANQINNQGLQLGMRKVDQMKRLKRQVLLAEKAQSEQGEQQISESQAVVSQQLKTLNNHYKMLIDNSVITTKDLQVSYMLQEKIKEMIIEHLPEFVQSENSEEQKEEGNDQKVNPYKDLGLSSFEIDNNRVSKIIDQILNQMKNADLDDEVLKSDKFGYSISKGSFLNLIQDGKPISSSVIDAYIKLINSCDQEFQKNYVYCFDTLFQQRLLANDGSFKNILNKEKFNDIKNREVLICPVQIPENDHWYLLCASLKLNQFFIVDSVFHEKGQQQGIEDGFKNFVEQFIKQLDLPIKNAEATKWETIVVKKAPTLKNKAESGLYACLNIEKIARFTHLLSSDKTFGYTSFIIDQGRKRITVEILTAKITTE